MAETASRVAQSWRAYLEAEIGFRNHWYPAAFTGELEGGAALPVALLGEKILLRRVDGKICAIEDRCGHRRVRFSAKLECYTPDTVTCWYHGFTYRFGDGALVQVLTDPECPLIGKMYLRTYPTAEAKGLVFVFIGDGDPPPLDDDVAPGFLDPGIAIAGMRRPIVGNWRLATENGFDTTHIYIHRHSGVVTKTDAVLPLGFIPQDKHSMEIVEEPTGPKGVVDKLFLNYVPIFQADIGDTNVSAVIKETGSMVAPEVSCWVPGALKLENFPFEGYYIFEWYVAIDERTHTYFQVLGKRVASEAEAAEHRAEAQVKWKEVLWRGFNDQDLFAREWLEEAYTEGEGWSRERLYKPDMCLLEWRKLASKHNRGIQQKPGQRSG
jgi:carbazole 1,9a-dioxygenase terminal dioxygenase component